MNPCTLQNKIQNNERLSGFVPHQIPAPSHSTIHPCIPATSNYLSCMSGPDRTEALRQKENKRKKYHTKTKTTFSFHLLPINNLMPFLLLTEPDQKQKPQGKRASVKHSVGISPQAQSRAGKDKTWMWPGRGSQMENIQHTELQVHLTPREAMNQNCIFPDAILYPQLSWNFLTEFISVWIPASQVSIQIMLSVLDKTPFSFYG